MIEDDMNRFALTFYNRQHSINIQSTIDNIHLFSGSVNIPTELVYHKINLDSR